MPECYRWLDLPNHARPFGGQIVIDHLRQSGHQVNDYSKAGKGTVLASLYWCEGIYDWIRFRARNKIRAPVIIGGNHATGSPAAILPFCDGVYMGDGDEWDGVDRTHIYSADNLDAKPCVCEVLPRKCMVVETKAVAKASFAKMELSRGCKYKCHYCQYAWMKRYREQSADYLCEQIAHQQGRVRLASADISQHSESGRIEAAAKRAGVKITTQDNALLSVAHRSSGTLEKIQRFGVDGMSEQLRRKIKKPIKTGWLVNRIAEYSRKGVGRCAAYNIFGLPGETREDFLEWDDTMRRIIDAVQPPFTWINSWNAFLPMPMTPLANSPSSWHNDARDLTMMAKTREYAKRRGVNVFDMPERTSSKKITERMLSVRGTEKSAHILQTVATRSVKEPDILREFERVEGYHLHGERPSLERK